MIRVGLKAILGRKMVAKAKASSDKKSTLVRNLFRTSPTSRAGSLRENPIGRGINTTIPMREAKNLVEN